MALWVERCVGIQKAAGLNSITPLMVPASHQGPPWCRLQRLTSLYYPLHHIIFKLYVLDIFAYGYLNVLQTTLNG